SRDWSSDVCSSDLWNRGVRIGPTYYLLSVMINPLFIPHSQVVHGSKPRPLIASHKRGFILKTVIRALRVAPLHGAPLSPGAIIGRMNNRGSTPPAGWKNSFPSWISWLLMDITLDSPVRG